MDHDDEESEYLPPVSYTLPLILLLILLGVLI